MYYEIKSILRNDTIFYSLVIVAVAVLAFGLGRLSVGQTPHFSAENVKSAVPILPVSAPRATTSTSLPAGEQQVQSASVVNADAGNTLTVIASKSGTKYHAPWCPGAKQIKETNRITFASAAEARASGYTPAANCPGLE